jgi:hypothetical protein
MNSNLTTCVHQSVIQRLFSRSMKVLLPIGYFPPISYISVLAQHQPVLEAKEHFVKQSLRNRCTILGANGPLNLLVPRVKVAERQTVSESLIHDETDWKTLHWRSLEAAYRNSPYFEYYEDDLKPFFEKKHTHHFQLAADSIELICNLLEVEFELEVTSEYQVAPSEADLRNAWNKREYSVEPPVLDFPDYIQVFSDRHPFCPDLSILDLLFCEGPHAKQYISDLKLREF